MKTCGKYILDAGGKPVPEPDLLKWAGWFQNAERHVAKEKLGPVFISTVFLGIDHSFFEGPPILWETMFFCDGKQDGNAARCAGSREQSEAMHADMRRELLTDWRNFTWRKFSNRKRRIKALRQLKRIKP